MYLGNMTLSKLRRVTHDVVKTNLKVEITIVTSTTH